MINTLKISSLPKFRLSRVLGVSAALLLTSATASFAAPPKKLTATDQLIDDQLRIQHPGVTLLVDKTFDIDPRFVADAAVAAINALPAAGKVLPSTVVTAALKRAPQFAADISKAALAKVYVTGINSLNSDSKKNAQASKIVTAAFSKGLANYKVGSLINKNPFTGYLDKSDIAAQITFQELSAFPHTSSTVQVVVTAAVKAGAKVKSTVKTDLEHNGVSGAVAGAIFNAAGTNNSKFDDATNANSPIVKAILTAAAKSASTHALEIAQAAGYAFATTYRETHPGGRTATDLLTEQQFKDANITAIVDAINAGLSTGNKKKFLAPAKKSAGTNVGQTLTSRVNAGITLAYNDISPALRDDGSGRNGVSFANGIATAVTPVN